MNKKRITALFLLVVLLCTSVFFVGCDNSNSQGIVDDNEIVLKENEYQIYYINENKNALKTKVMKYDDNKSVSDMAETFIDEINESMKKEMKDDSMRIKLNGVTVSNGIVTLDLKREYSDLPNVIRILLRASMVMSLTQIKGISYVSITVNGQTLKDETGNTINMMKSEDFINFKDDFPYTKKEVKLILYLADEKGQMLKKKEVETYYDYSVSYEKFIINELMKASWENQKDNGYKAVLPKELVVDMVYTKDGVCYVDFDESITKTVRTVSTELMLYSIVNSLSELSYVTNVQFSVEGEGEMKLYNEYDISGSFSRNLDLVLKEGEGNK